MNLNMDDQTQQQNQQGVGQPNEPQQEEVLQGGGGAPEAAPMPNVQPETQAKQVESGYERIKQIEKAAESGGEGQKEVIPKPQQPKQPPAKAKRKLASNTKYIKQNAGKGKAKDSQTWLLLFLDRLLKKEGERS